MLYKTHFHGSVIFPFKFRKQETNKSPSTKRKIVFCFAFFVERQIQYFMVWALNKSTLFLRILYWIFWWFLAKIGSLFKPCLFNSKPHYSIVLGHDYTTDVFCFINRDSKLLNNVAYCWTKLLGSFLTKFSIFPKMSPNKK